MQSMILSLIMCGKCFFLRIGDLLLFAVIAVLGISAFLVFRNPKHTEVTVKQFGEVIYCLDLSDTTLDGKKIVIKGEYENTICIQDGKLYVSEASCPDQLCKKSMPLMQQGGVICCVPNGLIITAEGSDAEWDVVIQ